MLRNYEVGVIVFGIVAWTMAMSAQTPRNQAPARDRAGQRPVAPQPAGTGRISGRVVAADTGRPLRRARVMVNAAELPGGRAAMTDDQGLFDFNGLPSGRYSVSASKSGFINLSYGQRRPRQGGTPLQLADGQQLGSVDFLLPRGGAIAGHVYDEAGEPAPGAMVRLMRYEYAQGSRQLLPSGNAETDDQGAYRVWGLNPGDYYVSATIRNFDVGGRGAIGAVVMGRGPLQGPGPGRGVQFGSGGYTTSMSSDANADALTASGVEQVAYAPTYFPGVSQAADAQPVSVGLSAEVLNINFGILLVKTAQVSGRVTMSDGSAIGAGMVNLLSEGTPIGGPGANLGARITGDGSFSINVVPPGRYTLRARAGSQDSPQFAQQSLTVGDGDRQNLTIVLGPGATLTGSVTFEGSSDAIVPDASQVRIVAPATDFSGPGPNSVARVDRQGRFTLSAVPAGAHWIRSQGGLRGWALKSVLVDGREVIDTPLDVRSGQVIGSVNLLFTDRLSEVNGTLTDNHQTPLTDFTVLAFPTDSSLWRPQARQIMTARPDQNGKFQIRGLPPGDYFLAPIDAVEQGEWFEPAFLEQRRIGAARLSIGEGDIKTQDFKLAPQ